MPGFAGTYTATPQQIADLLAKYIWPTQAMGPEDQLSPFARTLQSGVGTIVQPSEPPVRFLGRRVQDPLGSGMTGWSSDIPDGSTDSTATTPEANGSAGGGNISAAPASPFATGAPPTPFLPRASQNAPGGLPGMMINAGLVDPSNPGQPPAGGLLGLMQEYMRNNPTGDSAR